MVHPLKYTRAQITFLVILRWVIGFHFLFEGLDKLASTGWTSAVFLSQSNGLFAELFHALANNQSLLNIVDILNVWGQIFIGIGLVLGLFSKWAAYAGALLLFLYYIAIPPFIGGLSFIDKNLIEFFAFLIVAIFPTSQIIGIDHLLNSRKIKNYNNT